MHIFATKKYQELQNLLQRRNLKFFVMIQDVHGQIIPNGNVTMETAKMWIADMVRQEKDEGRNVSDEEETDRRRLETDRGRGETDRGIVGRDKERVEIYTDGGIVEIDGERMEMDTDRGRELG